VFVDTTPLGKVHTVLHGDLSNVYRVSEVYVALV